MLFTELAREKSSIFWERSFEHPFIQGLVSYIFLLPRNLIVKRFKHI